MFHLQVLSKFIPWWLRSVLNPQRASLLNAGISTAVNAVLLRITHYFHPRPSSLGARPGRWNQWRPTTSTPRQSARPRASATVSRASAYASRTTKASLASVPSALTTALATVSASLKSSWLPTLGQRTSPPGTRKNRWAASVTRASAGLTALSRSAPLGPTLWAGLALHTAETALVAEFATTSPVFAVASSDSTAPCASTRRFSRKNKRKAQVVEMSRGFVRSVEVVCRKKARELHEWHLRQSSNRLGCHVLRAPNWLSTLLCVVSAPC